jgi:hypothetical protein
MSLSQRAESGPRRQANGQTPCIQTFTEFQVITKFFLYQHSPEMTVPTSGLPLHNQEYQNMNSQIAGLLQSQTTPYGICGGQSVTGTGFSPNNSIFPLQHYSTNAPYSFIHRRYMTLVTDVVKKDI